ncbi:hypothetical protein PVK06_009006 [Gossypium arboreum]|uniref:Uncharacterized protein n=1 Tax=Gossypium arboreum TaxID=29729 RepID=A0ABR0QMP9_GOSAR|nr:hypothetical protein PVK06_009006 [Gossypium arboreum]
MLLELPKGGGGRSSRDRPRHLIGRERRRRRDVRLDEGGRGDRNEGPRWTWRAGREDSGWAGLDTGGD